MDERVEAFLADVLAYAHVRAREIIEEFPLGSMINGAVVRKGPSSITSYGRCES
jgi:hypothetical protein